MPNFTLKTIEISVRAGFPACENGPYVTALRQYIQDSGTSYISPGTWANTGAPLTYEEKAKAYLATFWEMKNGYTYSIKNLDTQVISKRFDTKKMKSFIEFRPKAIIGKVQQGLGALRVKIKTLFFKKFLKIQNPYI